MNIVTTTVITNDKSITQSAGDSQNLIYDKPWTRVGPYAIGLLTAFALLEHNDRIKNMGRAVGTTLVFLGLFFTIFLMYITATYDWDIRKTGGWSQSANLAMAALSRLFWTIGVAFFVLATYAGHGSFVGWLLSRPFWEPFGRLTFAAYLFHPAIIRVVYYTRHQLFSVTYYEMATFYVGFLTFSYVVAAVLFCMVEMPAANLTNALVRKK
jgi:peptidoglycan/LPS O-acetylase OafA/YrhL